MVSNIQLKCNNFSPKYWIMKFAIIKFLTFVILAYILIFNIGCLLETHMIKKEYMVFLLDIDYRPLIKHTQYWCKINISLINLMAILFIPFLTKRNLVRIVCLFVIVALMFLLNSRIITETCNLIDIVDKWRLVNLAVSIIIAIFLGILTAKDNYTIKERGLLYWISCVGVISVLLFSALLIYIL